MEALRPDDALTLLAGGADPEAVGPFAGRAWIALDLDEPSTSEDLWGLLPTLPCVVIGLGSPGAAHTDAVDVLLSADPDAPRPWIGVADLGVAVEELANAIDASPHAAVTLAQLLRIGATLGAPDALVAESMAYGMLQSSDRHQAWLQERTRPQHRPAAGPPVQVTRTDGSVTVTLARPGARNAYDVATRDALVDALRTANLDPTVLEIELRGEGPDFCAGGDLSEFGTVPTPAIGHLVRTTRSAGLALLRARAHTVARLHGACIGAGIELPAFCDHVVAERATTSIRLPELAFGLIPGAGGTASIPRRIGRHRTAWLGLTGATIGAEAALAWGLVDEVG